MTQAPEPHIQPLPFGPPPPPYLPKHSRLYQTAAWVVIVAGIVFIVSVIFFAGAMVGGHDQPFRHHHGMYGPEGPPGGMVVFPGPVPPGMGPGWPGGPPMMPGPFGPGMGPGGPAGPGGHGGGRGGPPPSTSTP